MTEEIEIYCEDVDVSPTLETGQKICTVTNMDWYMLAVRLSEQDDHIIEAFLQALQTCREINAKQAAKV